MGFDIFHRLNVMIVETPHTVFEKVTVSNLGVSTDCRQLHCPCPESPNQLSGKDVKKCHAPLDKWSAFRILRVLYCDEF